MYYKHYQKKSLYLIALPVKQQINEKITYYSIFTVTINYLGKDTILKNAF